jgi:hypothetical protein
MIKFSNISGASVNNEPKPLEISKEHLELEALRATILGLLDQTLTIRNYGTGYKHEQLISTKIDGKEMFIEALLDVLAQKENNKAISYLEALKETNKDWKSIDDKITEVINENVKLQFLNENNIYLEKVKDFLDKYALSEDFEDFLEQQVLKVEDYEGAKKRSEVATHMLESEKYTSKYPKGRIRSIANKFAYRAKQISEIK